MYFDTFWSNKDICLDVFAFICNQKNVAVHARANIDTPKKCTWRVTYFHMDEEISLGEIP